MKRLLVLPLILFATSLASADSITMFGATLLPDGTINNFTPLVPGVDITLLAQRMGNGISDIFLCAISAPAPRHCLFICLQI